MKNTKEDSIVVTFDGKYLSYEDDNKLIKIPALSGQKDYQDPKTNQDEKNKGLLPSGTYNVKQSEYQSRDLEDITLLEDILEETKIFGNWPGGEDSWGKERVWLEPSEDTDTQGRTNLSIHGGIEAGSRDCSSNCVKQYPSYQESGYLTVKR